MPNIGTIFVIMEIKNEYISIDCTSRFLQDPKMDIIYDKILDTIYNITIDKMLQS